VDKKSVVIVDDDDSICSSLVSLIRSDAVTTRTASTMEGAEALLKAERFDLAIVDLRLKGSGNTAGLDLISAIKAQAPETQVVIFTGYGSPEVARAARERGAVDYWEKNIKVATLIEKLRALGIFVGHRKRPGTTK